MRKGILQTFGGGVAGIQAKRVFSCQIGCGFTVENSRIRFSFPFTINNVPFNYSLIIEPDLDQTDTFFSNPSKLEGLEERAERWLIENLPIALRESLHAIGEAALFSAGVPIMETKTRMVERLQKRSKKEVVRQLKQKTGKAKIPDSDYPKLLEREKTLSGEYLIIKREHDAQYKNYCEANHKRTHNRYDWQRIWNKEAASKYSHLPPRFVKLFAEGYTAKQIAHQHVADDFGVKVSALERFILPRARKAQNHRGNWYVEYI